MVTIIFVQAHHLADPRFAAGVRALDGGRAAYAEQGRLDGVFGWCAAHGEFIVCVCVYVGM